MHKPANRLSDSFNIFGRGTKIFLKDPFKPLGVCCCSQKANVHISFQLLIYLNVFVLYTKSDEPGDCQMTELFSLWLLKHHLAPICCSSQPSDRERSGAAVCQAVEETQ